LDASAEEAEAREALAGIVLDKAAPRVNPNKPAGNTLIYAYICVFMYIDIDIDRYIDR